MADAGEGQKRDKPRKKPRKKKSGPGKKARKVGAGRPGKKPNRRRRVSVIVAIAHPVRRCILRTIADFGEPCSPIQVSRETGLPIGTVAYHARVLWRLGAVEPVGEQRVRGAVEHFYDSTIEDDPPIEALLEETRKEDDEDE